MREPEKKTIDGVTFEVTPLGYAVGRKAFVRLTKAVGPALAEAAQGSEEGSMSAALERLVSSVEDSDLEWFADVLGKTTRFSTDGSKWPFLSEANRETLFSGRIFLFFQWLAFALEVNFSDFLSFLRSV